jgi:Pectate lyase superfamily protein
MGQGDREVDVSRRDLGALLGVLGGGAALSLLSSACSNAVGAGTTPEGVARQSEALTGTSIVWFDTINGPCTDGTAVLWDTPGPSGAYEVAIVFGYNTPGDGGGGVFYWDYTSTTAPNGGTVFAPGSPPIDNACQPAVSTGRWKRLYSGPMNVKWFGAYGNGTTPDQGAIQNAISAATSLAITLASADAGTDAGPDTATPAGPTVYIPPGIYAITSPIEVGFSDLTIEGNPGTTLVLTGGSNIPVMQATAASSDRLRIRALTLSDPSGRSGGAPEAGGAQCILYITTATNVLIEDVTVLGYWNAQSTPPSLTSDGIAVSNGSGGQLRNVKVAGATRAGFYVPGDGQYVTLTGCESNGCAPRSLSGGAINTGFSICGSQVVLSGCRASHHGNSGVLVTGYPGSSTAANYVQIHGGQFHNNGMNTTDQGEGSGILIITADSLYPVTQIRVVGADCFLNSGAGISVIGGDLIDLLDVSCRQNGQSGVWISGSGDGPALSGCPTYISVRGAAICGNGTGGSLRVGILIGGGPYSGDHVTVENVTLNDAGTQSYGIQLNAGTGAPPTNLRICNVVSSLDVYATYSFVTAPPPITPTNYCFMNVQGAGDPAAYLPTAPPGSTYSRLDGAAGSMFYVMQPSGWHAVA